MFSDTKKCKKRDFGAPQAKKMGVFGVFFTKSFMYRYIFRFGNFGKFSPKNRYIFRNIYRCTRVTEIPNLFWEHDLWTRHPTLSMAPVINPPVHVRTRSFAVWECLIVSIMWMGTRTRESTNHSQSEFWIIFTHCTALLLLKFWASRSCLDSVYVNRSAVNKLRIISGLWTIPGPRQSVGNMHW